MVPYSMVTRMDTPVFQQLITAARGNGCKGVIFFWCRGGEDAERKVVAWSTWCLSSLQGWTASRYLVQNGNCGGPMQCTTSLLLLLPSQVATHMGSFDDADEADTMDSYLDDSNMKFSDYITDWTLLEARTDTSGSALVSCNVPQVECIIDWNMEQWAVF